MDLEEMSRIDPEKVDKTSLVQRESVVINGDLEREGQISSFISQIKNPYCYLEGEVVVKLTFSESNRSLEDCLRAFLTDI